MDETYLGDGRDFVLVRLGAEGHDVAAQRVDVHGHRPRFRRAQELLPHAGVVQRTALVVVLQQRRLEQRENVEIVRVEVF
jgi:hypothetical protein